MAWGSLGILRTGKVKDPDEIQGKSSDKCGTVLIKVEQISNSIDLISGDDLHERRIQDITEERAVQWAVEVKESFEDAAKQQAVMTSKFCKVLEGLRLGWKIKTFAVVDMQNECLRSLVDQLEKVVDPDDYKATIAGPQSVVYAVLNQVFLNFAYFDEDKSMRVFAGGGVRAPLPPLAVQEISKIDNKKTVTVLKGGCPSSGMSRQIGFPLCQELIQAGHYVGSYMDHMAILKSGDRKVFDRNLSSYMERAGYSTWRGAEYVDDISYDDLDPLLEGFVEAATLYQPTIVPTFKADRESLKNRCLEEIGLNQMIIDRFDVLVQKFDYPETLVDSKGKYKSLEVVTDNFFKCNKFFEVPEAKSMNAPHYQGLITSKESTFNMDVDLIERMFESPAPNTSIQLGVWVICTVPSDPEIIDNMVGLMKKFDDFKIDDLPDTDPRARQHLLVILCPENMMIFPQMNPFEEVLRTIGQMR